MLGSAILITGCASTGPKLGKFATATTSVKDGATCLSVEADWNDIDAAVDVAASGMEMAVISRNPGPTWGGEGGDQLRRVFKLKTVRDEPVTLEISRGIPPASGPDDPHNAMVVAMSMNPPPDPHAPVLLDLTTRIGLFGDPERERSFLRAVANRLDELKGRDTAPLD